jgi:putative N6-adenine-specific DNA methylase
MSTQTTDESRGPESGPEQPAPRPVLTAGVTVVGESDYFAVTARGLEGVAGHELELLGARQIQLSKGGVAFRGDKALLYRANLWLRSVSRILKPLREFAAANEEMLYAQTRRVRWEDILSPTKTIAVYATQDSADKRHAPPQPPRGNDRRGGARPGAQRSFGPRGAGGRGFSGRPPHGAPPQGLNTQFMALKIKDAICDRMRREMGARPNVDTFTPQFRIHAHFTGGRCSLSLDSSGTSLHERGYRIAQVPATLKETLAAGLLQLSGYDGSQPLWDPMCGSGTIVVEAALLALRIAPGLYRPAFAFYEWPDFDGKLWTEITQDVRSQRREKLPHPIYVSDLSENAVEATRINARQAGIDDQLTYFVADATTAPPPCPPPARIVTNPPYAERMGSEAGVMALYQGLGENWKANYKGWSVAMFSGNLPLARQMPLEATGKYALNNGPLSCRLLMFEPGVEPAPVPETAVANADLAPATSAETSSGIADDVVDERTALEASPKENEAGGLE